MNADAFDWRRVARAFGAVLRNTRNRQGLSQEALCEGANIDRTYPSLLERGLRTPTLPVVIEIAQALGSSLHNSYGKRSNNSGRATSDRSPRLHSGSDADAAALPHAST
jgi:transcriptional regulator with XRE-family HTH domain